MQSKISIIKFDSGAISGASQTPDGISGLIYYNNIGGLNSGAKQYVKLFSPADLINVFIPSSGPVNVNHWDNNWMLRYQVEKYFSITSSPLYVCVVDADESFTGCDYETVLLSLKDFSNGEIKQYGVLGLEYFNTNAIEDLNDVAEKMLEEKSPAIILYSAPFDAGVEVEDLLTLQNLDSENVSVLIGAINDEKTSEIMGNALSLPSFCPAMGVTLGLVASSKVSENIAWTGKFDVSSYTNNAELRFNDGTFYKDKVFSLIETLDDYGYLFYKNFVGQSGSYINYSYTATSGNSDFKTIERNRTWNKAFRGLDSALFPYLNSPLLIEGDKIAPASVALFKNACNNVLINMKNNTEISDYEVIIDANQTVTDTVKISIRIKRIGVSKYITVELGYKVK